MKEHMEKEPQDKRESNTDYNPEVHMHDVNNQEVFKNTSVQKTESEKVKYINCRTDAGRSGYGIFVREHG